MFGFITPNLETLSEEEKTRYQSIYCGLCHSLRDNYSNISRLALSYDLTFLVLLLSSLYEPSESYDFCNCIFHPGKKYKTSQNEFSDYCADITVILAYHKILDDVNDDNKLKAKIGENALRNQYKKVKEKLPEICEQIENLMQKINKSETEIKNSNDSIKNFESGDKISKYFGIILANIFSPFNDVWKDNLGKLGANLGRFIYFMDAAIDLKDDLKSNSYNPFRFYNENSTIDEKAAERIKNQLTNFAGMATIEFEKLPLVQDINILRNILYEGMWIQFNYHFFKEK